MLTVLATLPFLAALAIASMMMARMIQEDGGKMLAALKGESRLANPVMITRPVTLRMSARHERTGVRPAGPQWRAAA